MDWNFFENREWMANEVGMTGEGRTILVLLFSFLFS